MTREIEKKEAATITIYTTIMMVLGKQHFLVHNFVSPSPYISI